MESSLSAAAANVVIEEIENKILKNLKYPIQFYYRCIDDTSIFLPTNKVNNILNRFNSF